MKRKNLIFTIIIIVIMITCVFVLFAIRKKPAIPDENDAIADEPPVEELPEPLPGETQIQLLPGNIVINGSGAGATDNDVEIAEAGTYTLSGELPDGQIYINAGVDDDVTLILKGVEIINSREPAIYVRNAEHTEIVLAKGTKNRVISGSEPEGDVTEATAEADAEAGAIYARDDLSISGDGELTVYGYINNGIHTSNDLVIEGGNIEVEAVNNGIKGKDSVEILGGNINITSGSDGIKSNESENDEDGVVNISGGEISITSTGKAIHAENNINVSGGTFNIASVDDALHSEKTVDISGGDFNIASGDDGIHAETELTIEDGNIVVSEAYEGLEANQILIYGGDISLTTSDDGMNAFGGQNNMGGGGPGGGQGGDPGGMGPGEGEEAGGRGHRQGMSGNMPGDMPNGMSGNRPDMGNGGGFPGGDGMSGNRPDMGEGGFPGGGGAPEEETNKVTEETPNLIIYGGNIYVNAEGDGLDSNGNLKIAGGYIIVDGPKNDGNGALDSGSENGGTITIDGGTILAIGMSGMAENFEEESEQYSFKYNTDENIASGSEIVISDADGNELISHTTIKDINSIVFSSPDLKDGETYSIKAGDLSLSITLDGISTSEGSSSRGFGGGHGGPSDN